MTETLPRLLDCKAVMAELGVPRATAENLMRDEVMARLDELLGLERVA